jgi:hypothetical protein
MIISVAKKKKRLRSKSKKKKKGYDTYSARMRGEMETMVTALVLEERLSRGNERCEVGSITF